MLPENPYTAPGSLDSMSPSLPRSLLAAAGMGLALGTIIGVADIHHATGDYHEVEWAYFVSGLGLGAVSLWRCWAAWPPMAASLFVVHLIAIASGYRSPYVESSYLGAVFCLQPAAVPSAGGLFLGASVHRFLLLVASLARPSRGDATDRRDES